MKELHLVHPLALPSQRGGAMSVIKENAERGQGWERTAAGDYVIRLGDVPDYEFLVPQTGVKYEKRSRVAAPAKKAG